MASAQAGRLVFMLAGITALAACEPGQVGNLFGAGQSAQGAGNAAPTGAVAASVQDVEAPDVFQVTDAGLWDGRPSLGGVWIAHPDVTVPERVLVRNHDNGKSVNGALFRRERENPGPRFQVSSDAAAELGMLAGAPSTLSVVALRQVEVAAVPAPVISPEIVAPVPVVAEPVTAATAAVAAEPVATADPIAQSVAAATVAAISPPETIAAAPVEPVVPIAQIAAAAIEAATAKNPAASLPAETIAQAALEATAAVSPVARPANVPQSAPAAPFIHVAVFDNEPEADDTSEMLRSSGIIPTIDTLSAGGQTRWRVMVGPISSPSDLTALLDQVQGLGFPDAYPIIK